MKGDHMGTGPTNPSPRELPLSNQTRFNLGEMHPSALPQAAVQGDRSEPASDALSGGPQTQHVDVLIVGAGLFGIGAACYLQTHCPTKSFAILEARQTLGGTWDL